jgi:hypothetical protein
LEASGIPASKREVMTSPPFPDIPLIVLSATIHGKISSPYNSKANQLQWAQWQSQLAALSNHSQHITANNTQHDIQQEKPWLVIAAIDEVIRLNSKVD